MKNYVQDVGEMKTYLDRRKDSVYTEERRPKDHVRIWLSYDIEDGYGALYDPLYALFNELGAESWGGSVATFLVPIEQAPDNAFIAEILVNMLQEKEIVAGNSFEDEAWKKTKGLSLYVFYRYYYHDTSKEGKENENPKVFNSDHFVLLHNAPIKHADGWK